MTRLRRFIAIAVVALAIPLPAGAQTPASQSASEADLPKITSTDDGMVVTLPDGERLELSFEEPPAEVNIRAKERSRSLIKSGGCDPYMNRYAGYAPVDPASHASLGLPPVDRNCDGRADRPWYVERRLDWHSVDNRLGAVDMTDVRAAIVRLRTRRSSRVTTLFAAVDSGGEAIAGYIKERDGQVWGSAVVGRHRQGTVIYRLFAAVDEPLSITILESGTPLEDGQLFDRAVVLTAAVEGGSGSPQLSAAIDGAAYALGSSFGSEGFHTIEVTATTGTETASATSTFSIDFSAPDFYDVQPPNNTVLGINVLTLSGQVSADAVSVTVSGVPASLGDPSGDWRSFSAGLNLIEGVNTLILHAEDGAGRTTDRNHVLIVDSLSPEIAITSPVDGFVTDQTQLSVSGTVVDPNLASVSVNGVPATVGGGSFTASIVLVEGTNQVVAVAVDALGNTTQTTISVVLDTTPPILTVFESGAEWTDDLLLGRPAVITVIAADATEVDLTATIDGESYLLGAPFAASGSHVFAVNAVDQAGNTSSANRAFSIDTNPPLIDDLSPFPGTVVKSTTIIVAGRVDDDAVEVTVAGILATFVQQGTNYIGWSVSGIPLEQEGLNLLPLRAIDGAGNTTEFDLSYYRDTLAPELTLTAPVEGAVTRFENLTVTGTAIDANLDRLTVNGTPAAFGSDGSFSSQVILVEGANTITVVAADSVFQETTIVRNVVLDSAPPVISVTNGGSALVDGLVSNQPVAPVIDAADDTAVTLTITLNGAPFASGTPIADEGSYVLVVAAEDAAGNTSSLELGFRIDVTPPAISGLSLVDGSVISVPSPLLTGACDDAVAVTVDGQPATITAGTFSFAGLALSEGANIISITATDDVGNESTATITVTLDSAGPTLSVTAPADGDLVGDTTVTVTGTADDPHLESVTVAGRSASLAGSSFQAQVALSQEGANVLTVAGVDRAGNTSELVLTVERDTTAPVLVVEEPGASAILGSSAVAVSGSASDAHQLTVTVNSQNVTVGPDGSFNTDLQLGEGSRSVAVEARDEVGNAASVNREIRIDLSAPELRITSPAAGDVLATSSVTVTGTVSDVGGTDRVTVNGQDAVLGESGSFTLADLELNEGPNTILARAWDDAGNTGTRSIDVEVDTVAPSVVATIPADGATGVPVSARPRIRFSEAMDFDSLNGRIRLIAGGATLEVALSAVGDGSEIDVVPVEGLADDTEYLLEVDAAATDRAGHPLEAGRTATFSTLDSTPPQPPIVDAVVSPACFDTLEVTGLAEAGSRVIAAGDVHPASVDVEADGSFTLRLEAAVGEGAVEIEVTAEDPSGNQSTPSYVVVELDCSPPHVVSSNWDGDTTISVRFNEALDEATVAVGTSVVVDGQLGPLTFTVSMSGAELLIELVTPPQVGDLPLVLELSSEITDLAGNPATPYSQLFADPSATTFIAGEVFSDKNSLELPGARIVLEQDGAPIVGDPPVVTADGRGRFQLPVVSSPVVVRIEADGYLPTWRRSVPIPNTATLLFDVRLSERSDLVLIEDSTQVEVDSARLTISSASLPTGGVELEFSPVSEQGLPDLLPLGWRPLAAAHVGLPEDVALDPPAVLEFTAVVPPDAVIARYDEGSHAWISENLGGTLDVAQAGIFVLLAADPDPTSPGVVAIGSVLPTADPLEPSPMTATLTLDPPVILPMETSLATVVADPETITPSGHPVEARLDEVLHVVDGGVLVAPPVAIDLFLYRQPDDTLAATFGLGASETARRIALDAGVKTINIRTLPDEVRTQDLVGPDGAGLSSPDGIGLVVPPGALDRVIGIELAGQSLDALPLVLPAGLEAVSAANLGIGDSTFSVPATLSFPGAGEPDRQYLLLSPVEADGVSSWRLVGLGALEGDRIVCGPDQLAGFPAPGVSRTSLYVLARSTTEDWGLLTGAIFDVDGDPATANCLVTATGGLVQLADNGIYALAAPAGTVDLSAEQLVSRNSGQLTATATAGDVSEGLDILIEVVRPRIIATSPANGADRVSTATTITVDFSEPLGIDPENPWGIDVLIVAGETNTPKEGTLDLSESRTRLTWTPVSSFPSAAQVVVTVDVNLHDLQGYALDIEDNRFVFGVERYIGNEDVDESKIRIFMPGRDSANPTAVVIEGEEGAVPSNIWMRIEYPGQGGDSFQADGNGAFRYLIDPADDFLFEIGDTLLLHLSDSNNQENDLYVIPLLPWLTPDGLAAYFNVDGGTFVTTEGIGVTAPWAAFPDTATVRAGLLKHADVLPLSSWPSFAEARAAARLDLTVEAARTLQLVIPGDAPSDTDATFHACMRIEVAGKPHPMLMRTATWDATAQAYITSPAEDILPEDAAKALAKAAAEGNPDPLLPGIRQSMDVVILEPIVSDAKKTKNADLVGRLFVAKGTVEGDVQVKAMFMDSAADVVYAFTHFAPSSAALVAFDYGGSGPSDASEISGYAYLGKLETLTTGTGATVPIRPDDDFVLARDRSRHRLHILRARLSGAGIRWLDRHPSRRCPGL